MVSKTRDKLIEVARQLFAYKGVENTTMNDIAAASDKGRRTIYTYFRNKREIFDAVIERQSNAIIGRLQSVVDDSSLSPEDKLKKYLGIRFDIIAESTPNSGKPRMLIGHDHKKVEKIYNMAVVKERELFARMLREGVDAGVFDGNRIKDVQGLLAMTYFSVDYCHSHQSFDYVGIQPAQLRDSLISCVTKLIIK